MMNRFRTIRILAGICFLLFSCKTQSLKNNAGYGGGWAEAAKQPISKLAYEKVPEFSNNSTDSCLNSTLSKPIQKTNISKINSWDLNKRIINKFGDSNSLTDTSKLRNNIPIEKNSRIGFNMALGSVYLYGLAALLYLSAIYTLDFWAALLFYLATMAALVALVCGIVGLVRIKKSHGKLRGKGRAVFAIVIPFILDIGIILYLIWMTMQRYIVY